VCDPDGLPRCLGTQLCMLPTIEPALRDLSDMSRDRCPVCNSVLIEKTLQLRSDGEGSALVKWCHVHGIHYDLLSKYLARKSNGPWQSQSNPSRHLAHIEPSIFCDGSTDSSVQSSTCRKPVGFAKKKDMFRMIVLNSRLYKNLLIRRMTHLVDHPIGAEAQVSAAAQVNARSQQEN
jgi:hypothetical protein